MSDNTMARFIAELINGGDWDDPNLYTEEQKELWRKRADKINGVFLASVIAGPYRQSYDLSKSVISQGANHDPNLKESEE